MRLRFSRIANRFLFLGMLLLCGGISSAQINLIQEDFNSFPTSSPALPAQGWVNHVLAGDTSFDQWLFSNPGGRSFSAPIAGRYAIFDSDNNSGGGGVENVAIESPSFSSLNYTVVRLRFDQYFEGIYNNSDSILVEVYNGVKWQTVYSYTGTSSIANSQDLNITSHLSSTINGKVRFRFVGDWSYYWAIDNIRVVAYYDYDVAIDNIAFSAGTCGSSNDSITVSLTNLGLQSISNFGVRARVQGTSNGSPINTIVSANFAGTIGPGAKGTIKLPPVNTASGGSLALSAWTQLSNDQQRVNDTLYNPVKYFLGTPNSPSVSGVNRCGQGTLTLNATAVSSSDSVVWYDAANAVAPVGTGLSYTTPVLGTGNYTYYAAAGRGILDNHLQTAFTANNGQSGVMFDVYAKRSIVVDSFEVSIDAGTHLVEIYYKQGSYVGFETNSAAWTLLGTATVTSNKATGGSGIFVNVGNQIVLPSASTYAFYIQLPNSSAINYTNGAFNFGNAELSIQTGAGKGPNFGATFSPRAFNGGLYYSYLPLCESARTPVQIEVKALPAGSKFIQGKPFVGTFNTGLLSKPHVVASGDSLCLEILPPSTSNNAQFGSQWKISKLQIETSNGTPITTSDTLSIMPGTSSNARFIFVPGVSLSDSLIHIKSTITSLASGCDTLIEAFVYVAPRPNASFTYTAVCSGKQMKFVNQSSILPGSLTFDWDFAGLGSSKLENPEFNFPNAGNYQVILKATSDYGYVDYDTQAVVVIAVPRTSFIALNACEGAAVKFTNSTTMPSGQAKFSWDFGDGIMDSTESPSHLYASPGTYTVRFRVEVNGCSASSQKTVTQAPRATVKFSAVSSCNNTQVTFKNLSTVSFGSMGYKWDFGDSIIANSINPKHNYAGFGSFQVTLKAFTDLGCVDSFSLPINVIEAPEIAFNHSAPCVGESIKFNNQSVIPAGHTNSYEWYFGDGTMSNSSNPSHTYPGIGAYTLLIRSSSTNGCTDSVQTTITVNEKPQAVIVAPALVCDGEVVTFLNSTVSSNISQVTYDWRYGNGASSKSKDTSFVYSSAGNYASRLIATITGGCADTAYKSITVAPLPKATFTYASLFTQSGTMQFWADEADSGVSYTWFFNDGYKSYLKDPIHTFTVDRTYSVQLNTESSQGCKAKHTKPVPIYRLGNETPDYEELVQLYPNPNQGVFSLHVEGIGESMHLVVVNALGQEVDFKHETSSLNTIRIAILNSSKGVYFVQLQTVDGKIISKRFVIQ